ncbi:hypothetical protein BH10BDE1_BH10BDE1_02510 [soil metagenome]
MIQNRRVLHFLLAVWLVIPAFSTRAQAEPVPTDATQTDSHIDPQQGPQQESPLSDVEYKALHLAFRGFVAVTLPGGIHNGCEGHEASEFVRRHHEFYLSWYTITMGVVCANRPEQQAVIWFQCSDRNTLTCTLSQPYQVQ